MAIREQGEFAGLDAFVWFFGVVEDRNDPLSVGRVRVRCYGWHDASRTNVPTESLPWAQVMSPIHSAAMSGIGFSSTGLVEGTTVIGFFLDGKNAQLPMILGSVAGISSTPAGQTDAGFQDPNGRYPLETGFPDTPKLAYDRWNEDDVATTRNENIVESVTTVSGETWSEPTYRNEIISQYPYNHVHKTESGHAIEFDDTPDNERIHQYHKAGTYYEILPDGTRVTKVVGDDYAITINNKRVYVEGQCSVTVLGNAEVYVQGDRNEFVGGNYNLTVTGEQNITAAVTNINNDVNIDGVSTASDDHVSSGISGKGHTHRDSKGFGAGITSRPR